MNAVRKTVGWWHTSESESGVARMLCNGCARDVACSLDGVLSCAACGWSEDAAGNIVEPAAAKPKRPRTTKAMRAAMEEAIYQKGLLHGQRDAQAQALVDRSHDMPGHLVWMLLCFALGCVAGHFWPH